MSTAGDKPEALGLAEYSPRAVFRPFHVRFERWACLVAHRRCGKTVACIADLVSSAYFSKLTDARYAYVAPQFNQAKDIAWTYVHRMTEGLGVIPNESELRVDFPNGARVRLYGADNAGRIRGIYLDGVIMDEPADMRPSVWPEIVRPLLSDRFGWATFIGTPKGHNAFYHIYQAAVADPTWLSLRLRASETGIIPQSELDDARKAMTEDQYAQEYETSFEAAILGSFFGRDMNRLEQEGRITRVEYDPALPVFTAWDLGHTDDTAIWWFQVVRGEVHVLEAISKNHEGIDYYANEILRRPYTYGLHLLPHDAKAKTLAASGKSIEQQLQAHGLKCRIAPQLSVEDGIQATRLTLRNTWFDRVGCFEGIEALKTYRREYDEDRNVFREKPLHSWESHYADGFRILAVSWKLAKVESVPDRTKYPLDLTFNEIVKRATEKRLLE